MSAHQMASFARSCVIQPRHPKTNKPTTIIERNSFQGQNVGESFNSNISSKNNYSKSYTRSHQFQNNLVQTNSEFQGHDTNFVITPPTKHTKASLLRLSNSQSNRPSTAFSVNKNMSLHSNQFEAQTNVSIGNEPKDLTQLINDDDEFFKHLQYLKNENKKTLKKLETMYNYSLKKRREPVEDNHYSNEKPGRSKIVEDHNSLLSNNPKQAWDEHRQDVENVLEISSEDELDEKLKVKIPDSHVNILPGENEYTNDFRGRSSSYDVISNMWENFSVDEYVPYTRRSKKDRTDWSPSITIPEPFQMTIRDEARAKGKSKRIEKIEMEKLQKKLEEEVELQKKIVPTPVPPTTFLPLYDEIKEHQEKKRQYVRDLSKEILKSSEKPFSFSKREDAKKELKRSKSLNNMYLQHQKEKKTKNMFKANPFPDKLFDLTLADHIAEQEEYRKIKIKLRSEEMLASSSLPMSMKTRGNMRQYYPTGEKTRRAKNELRERKAKSFQPEIRHDIPDFETLQKKFEQELDRRKNVNTPTICEPFNLQTAQIPNRRSKFSESIEVKKTTERPPSGRPHSRSRSSCNTLERTDTSWRGCSPVISLNETTRLRQERLRQSLEKSKQDNLRETIENFKKEKQQNQLKKKISKKAAVNDVSRNRPKDMQDKLDSFRQADNARLKEYKGYLREMDGRLDDRPLLFERESQTNAKRKAQRRYEEILQEAGVEKHVLESLINSSTDGTVVKTNLNSYTEDIQSDDETDNRSYVKSNNISYESNEDSSFDNNQTDEENERSLVDDDDAYSKSDETDVNQISDDGSYTPPIANKTESEEEFSADKD